MFCPEDEETDLEFWKGFDTIDVESLNTNDDSDWTKTGELVDIQTSDTTGWTDDLFSSDNKLAVIVGIDLVCKECESNSVVIGNTSDTVDEIFTNSTGEEIVEGNMLAVRHDEELSDRTVVEKSVLQTMGGLDTVYVELLNVVGNIDWAATGDESTVTQVTETVDATDDSNWTHGTEGFSSLGNNLSGTVFSGLVDKRDDSVNVEVNVPVETLTDLTDEDLGDSGRNISVGTADEELFGTIEAKEETDSEITDEPDEPNVKLFNVDNIGWIKTGDESDDSQSPETNDEIDDSTIRSENSFCSDNLDDVTGWNLIGSAIESVNIGVNDFVTIGWENSVNSADEEIGDTGGNISIGTESKGAFGSPGDSEETVSKPKIEFDETDTSLFVSHDNVGWIKVTESVDKQEEETSDATDGLTETNTSSCSDNTGGTADRDSVGKVDESFNAGIDDDTEAENSFDSADEEIDM